MKDWILVTGLLVGFASLVTAHVALVVSLCLHRPRWRGLVALIVPPAGVIWALKARWWGLAAVWMVSLVLYLSALVGSRT